MMSRQIVGKSANFVTDQFHELSRVLCVMYCILFFLCTILFIYVWPGGVMVRALSCDL